VLKPSEYEKIRKCGTDFHIFYENPIEDAVDFHIFSGEIPKSARNDPQNMKIHPRVNRFFTFRKIVASRTFFASL